MTPFSSLSPHPSLPLSLPALLPAYCFLFLRQGLPLALADLELALQPKLASNSQQFFCQYKLALELLKICLCLA